MSNAEPSGVMQAFLPCVKAWFRKTFAAPSPAQVAAWPVIRRGDNTLLLAPTGSGKTLSAFMCAIDSLVDQARQGKLIDGVQVLYITPLKALGNDIQRNLLMPLAGIREEAHEDLPEIRVAVRSGDTTSAERAKMIRKPPHILITTPESLYLLLGSKRMSPNLHSVRTVIVDEIHALCDNKRGVHLSISLERLGELVNGPMQRVGCSATLRPIEDIAAFLVGGDDGRQRRCTIVDAGMRKDLDVKVMAPLPDFLEAGNTALWASAYELLLKEIAGHDTTLVFTNSRYKAERTSLRIAELDDSRNAKIGVHHGSVSKEMRLEAEDRLKNGELDALIATASLELGIDIGSVDLVYQLESPKTIATGLQRIGRAGHLLDATSKGRMLVFDRDELVEAAAIARAMTQGEMDAINIPRGCLDVLAQQIVGTVSTDDREFSELLSMLRRASPYADLRETDYEQVLAMLAGDHRFDMARPPLPLILWDRSTGRLTGARGSKQTSNMCVGTIAERSEYDIVIEHNNKKVGTVQSEFVDDCLRIGDVFVLGSSSWRVEAIRKNQLLVAEAPGSTPTVPWWHGGVSARSTEVGNRVGVLRRQIGDRLEDDDVREWLQKAYCLDAYAAAALVDYIREQQMAAGMVPDHEHCLVETWRDELGRPSIIIHLPLGRRLNQTWGEAIAAAAKREYSQHWSVTASNDLVVLMREKRAARKHAGVTAEELMAHVTPGSLPSLIRESVSQSASASSAFRDAAVCALQVPRARQGQRVPLWLQNHFSQELFEAAGKIEDFPVVAEVRRSHTEETLDISGLRRLLRQIDAGDIRLTFRDVDSPSPFAHSLLIEDLYRDDHQMGRGRRAQLLRLHRQVLSEVLSTEQMAQLLDQRAIDRLERRQQRRSEDTRAQTSDELAKVLHDLGDVPATVDAIEPLVEEDPLGLLAPLLTDRRVVAIELPGCETSPTRLVPADLWREYHDAFRSGKDNLRLSVLLPQLETTITGFAEQPVTKVIPPRWRQPIDRDEARCAVIERYLRTHGPVTVYELMDYTGWPAGAVLSVLARLLGGGKIAEGVYSSQKPHPQWVNKANLEEIHRLTMAYLKRELAACAPYEVVDFMTRWQHYHPTTRLQGIDGLREVIEQLQGFEIITGALESEMLSARISDYRPEMLERLIAAGEVCWRRVGAERIQRGKVTLCLRRDSEWLAGATDIKIDAERDADLDIPETTVAVRRYFRENPMAFFDDVVEETGRDPGEVRRAVWHLAWCGELTCDTYECLRYSNFQVSVSACYDLGSTPRKIIDGRITAQSVIEHMDRRRLDARLGRWATTGRLVPPKKELTGEEVVKRWTRQLLKRWGIVSRGLLSAEAAAPAWGDLVREFKRLELLGEVSRGYFIKGLQGEQYGLPEAIDLLRDCRARRSDGQDLGYLPDEPVFWITSRDPANLYASCLDVIDERGETLQRRMRRGNLIHKLVLQAGQALVYQNMQLVTLTRRQLVRCVEKLRTGIDGSRTPVRWGHWNGHPIDATPVAALLLELGFGFNGRRELLSPPPRKPADISVPELEVDVFAPYFAESSLIEYGPKWTVDRSSESLQPTLTILFELLAEELFSRAGWRTRWHDRGPEVKYRDSGRAHIYIAKSFADLSFGTRRLRFDDGQRRSLKPWNARLRAAETTDIDSGFVSKLRDLIRATEEITDRILDRQEAGDAARRDIERKIKETDMSEDFVMINRAPVFTLWGTVVAEHLGFNRGEAMSIAKVMAGLTAQKKGRMLGIFKPGDIKRGGSPKKTGLGEDFWIQLCDRPIPVKNTDDGVRGVVKDKPVEPDKVTTYLKSKFGEDLVRVEEAMAYLVGSYEPEELEIAAYSFYEQFRPEIPSGQRGWGAKGKLDLDFIRSLAKQ